ncbi:hypothetical protein QUA70_26350 [Microcoleus sp. LAD1_D5]|uniref:hypothetical protein n=1 Tax=unclassified Microcoleus TaxID=2642155 RepID=UPI002FD4114A
MVYVKNPPDSSVGSIKPDFNPKSIFYLRAFGDRGMSLDAVALVGSTGTLLI